MTLYGTIQSGVSNEAAVRALLNEAYNGWGSEEYFNWKYNYYPEYKPDEHTYSVVVDDELAAFRRVFHRELTMQGDAVPIHIYGDTAVAPAYQGQGLYSKLYERTKEYSLQSDATRGTAFNRKENHTFDANRDRGWSFRTLPLQLRILSPQPVLKTYASLIIDGLPAVDTVADTIGNRFHVGTSDGPLTFSGIVHANEDSAGWSVGPALSDTAVTSYVEAVSTDGNTIADLVTTSAQLAVNGHLSIGQSADSNTDVQRSFPEEIDITVQREISKAELDELVALYSEQPSFRRTSKDIRHITQYPGSDVLVARRDGTIVGYAVLGPRKNDRVVEGRVLEIQTEEDEAVFDRLIARAESRAIERGFDLVLVLSETDLGEQWAAVDQQVIIWEELEQTDNYHPLEHENLEITLYDVV